MDNGSAVTARITLGLFAPAGEVVSVDASFSYARDDPYAVRVAFHVGPGARVNWVFARELLAAGLDGPQGLGDVRVWPSGAGKARASLTISVSSPHGRADFRAPVSQIGDFIRRTYEVVPPGAESRHLGIDAGLADLLQA